jgi:hypothetical protein
MLLKDFLPHPSVSQFVRLYRIVHFSFDNNLTSFPVKAYAPRPEQMGSSWKLSIARLLEISW